MCTPGYVSRKVPRNYIYRGGRMSEKPVISGLRANLEQAQIQYEKKTKLLKAHVKELEIELEAERDDWQHTYNLFLDAESKLKSSLVAKDETLKYLEQFYRIVKTTYPEESRLVECAIEIVDEARALPVLPALKPEDKKGQEDGYK